MEYINGKLTGTLDVAAFSRWLQEYREVVVDLGTGDGRFVRHLALACPERLVIGLDACRENLRETSRKALPNALYLLGNAEVLPPELNDIANLVTINFPWGSLLAGLLEPHSEVIAGLVRLAKPGAWLEIRLNSSALREAGWSLAEGGAKLQRALGAAGFRVEQVLKLDAQALRTCPTTWAKRMAYGRDPYALYLKALCPGQA